MDSRVQGVIFNSQKFSVHDGAGIRTLVFLKGCPLRCAWCSNPESQAPYPELAFNASRCLGPAVCGRCLKTCANGAMQLRAGALTLDRSLCAAALPAAFKCAFGCPSGALNVYGETASVDSVLSRVEEDGAFYARSGGGVTLSGGEALAQPEFALALLREARRRHINTALETCGCYAYERLKAAAPFLNTLIYDLKHHDSAAHTAHTGVGNELILENFRRVCADFPGLKILARTPVVPGFNDSREAVRSIRALVPKRPGLSYELLPYHRMGQPKYEYLGRVYPMQEARLDEAVMRGLREEAGA